MTPRPAADLDELRRTLLARGREIVRRDGLDGLTMRALAAEAGTAVGLSYKVFSSRGELLAELTAESLTALAAQLDAWAVRPGGDVGDRLVEFADLLFDSDAPRYTHGGEGGEVLETRATAGEVRPWNAVVEEFLVARREAGEIGADVDVEAFAYLITSMLHHVVVHEGPYALPDRSTVERYLRAAAAQIATETTRSTRG